MTEQEERQSRPSAPIMPGGGPFISGPENILPAILSRSAMEKKFPEHPGIIAEEKLAPQLGTDPGRMQETNLYDIRILTKLNPMEILWTSLVSTVDDWSGGKAWRQFAEEYMYHKRSEGGWNTQNIIKALGSLRGVSGSRAVARKPNVLARNLWRREWKEEAIEKGEDIAQE